MECFFIKYKLHFKRPAGTSRGILYGKETYFILLQDSSKIAFGECNRFVNLSFDDRPGYEEKLKNVCERLPKEGRKLLSELRDWPSIYFGVEMVLKDWEQGARQIFFPEIMKEKGFSVPINGLIWMGEKENMEKQVLQKLREGYTSIKLKIGALDFEKELNLIRLIRKHASPEEVELRMDANGAFSYKEAKEKLKRLSDWGISYIEQPIKAGQPQEMAALCEESPIQIALDEELIGITKEEEKEKLIQTIRPPLVILKPALIGGWTGADEWKEEIGKIGGSWIVTSALESNIGLNAIAQYTAQGYTEYAQGLGTGLLYTNNIPSPYTVDAEGLHFHRNKKWDFSPLMAKSRGTVSKRTCY